MTGLIDALQETAEECEAHPAYLGDGATLNDIDAEGGDSAFVTLIAYRCRAALAAAEQAEPPDLTIAYMAGLERGKDAARAMIAAEKAEPKETP